jgi:hypothetical protein
MNICVFKNRLELAPQPPWIADDVIFPGGGGRGRELKRKEKKRKNMKDRKDDQQNGK